MDQIGSILDQKGLKKKVFLYQKYYFREILFAEHTLLEEIIRNEVSPTVDFALRLCNNDINHYSKSRDQSLSRQNFHSFNCL